VGVLPGAQVERFMEAAWEEVAFERKPASLIQAATASRVDSVISNCTGREVFCCMTIARAATRSPWQMSRTFSLTRRCPY
jgi:hypothetical protein